LACSLVMRYVDAGIFPRCHRGRISRRRLQLDPFVPAGNGWPAERGGRQDQLVDPLWVGQGICRATAEEAFGNDIGHMLTCRGRPRCSARACNTPQRTATS
jgi:hypothetical protein